jgi:phytoene desaturase
MLTLVRTPKVDSPAEDRRSHAVIIGSGFGGLAAAVRLGARGYRVTILERLDAPGGRAYVYRQDGFTFDGGPTIITVPYLFEDLWTLCGRRFADDIDLRPMDPFYRLVFDNGDTLVCHADDGAMRDEVARIAPKDLAGYDRFMRHCRELCAIGFEKLGHVPFMSLADLARQAPDLVRLGAYRSVYGLVSSFVKDSRLRFALSFHPLFVGGNPFNTTAVYCMISDVERRWGVHWAMGGTGALVRGLVDLIEGQGGTLRLGAEVEEIEVEDGVARGVRLKTGERVAADIVVSNADAAFTYKTLVPAKARKRWTDRKLAAATYSMGLFVWYFGTRKRFEDVAHHTIIVGPRYRDHVKEIFAAKTLPKDMSLYLHRPTATDPSLAPDGCDAFYVLSPVPHLDADVDWTTHAETYRRQVEQRLCDTVLPGLTGEIVTSHVVTPLDFRDRLCSLKGAGFSLAPQLTQSTWFRPNNRSEDIKGLYLVGAGTQPGAGVPAVLSSARMLDQLVPDAVAR